MYARHFNERFWERCWIYELSLFVKVSWNLSCSWAWFFFLNASKFVFGPGLVVGDTDVTTGQVLAAVSGNKYWFSLQQYILSVPGGRQSKVYPWNVLLSVYFFVVVVLFCLLVYFGDRELSRSYVRSDMGRRGCRRKICAPAEYKSRQRECVCGREITGSSGSSSSSGSSLAAFTPQPQSFQPPAQHFTNHLFLHFTWPALQLWARAH